MDRTFTCVICGKKCTGWGNNPYPLYNGMNDECCDECNDTKVVPARIDALRKRGIEDDSNGEERVFD